ncbi:MAG: hypothetical protein Tsb0020_49820 [Haliangiales bacterium]
MLAALEASSLRVRAIDVGRAGARIEGALDKMLQLLAGEVAERRLLSELKLHPPDVMIAFDPATTAALGVVRDEGTHAAPVIAIVAELHPDVTWGATDADRYLTIDDEAAVELSEHGVAGERIIPVGPIAEWAFVDAAGSDRDSIRKQYRIDNAHPVVVVDVDGFGYERSSQVALQLSLVAKRATYLFDAGGDAEAASALRRQVPTLDIRAKLFGRTRDACRFWRCADIVVARPTPRSVARAMVLGAQMVAFVPEGRDGEQLAKDIESRGLGLTAASTLLLSSALEPLFGRSPSSQGRAGKDGAANVADIAWVVAEQRQAVLDERRTAARASTRARVEAAASAAEAAAQYSAAAGGLEDLSGDSGPAPEPPGEAEIAELRAEVRARLAQVSKTVKEAREAADRWSKRHALARRRGDDIAAREAERQADAERARMHASLAEMSQLQGELDRLGEASSSARADRSRARPRSSSSGSGSDRAGGSAQPRARASAGGSSSVDDLLEQMKRSSSASGGDASSGGRRRSSAGPNTVDDELAALKRKMAARKKRR